MTPASFNPTDVRFIKLGEKGKWEKSCIEDTQTIRLGFRSNQHNECLAGQWDQVRQYWLAERNGSETEATKDIREIRAFYELPRNTLWITFYNRLLYWGFADEEVIELPQDKSRIRRVIGKWSCKSLSGTTLHVGNIDGRVSKVQGFRRTICKVDRSDYLIRKIRGDEQPEVIATRKTFADLTQHATDLIRGLWWHDFELLVDLIFSRSGWQRISVLGKTEKDVDIDMLSPVTNKRAFVQIKSSCDYDVFLESLAVFQSNSVYDDMYFVAHTISDQRILDCSETGVSVIGPEKLAALTINAGLLDWLIKKHE